MAFTHRKLFIDPINETISQLCKPYCESAKNVEGICPIPCLSQCMLTCNHPFLSQNPPPSAFFLTPPLDPPHKPKKLSLPVTIFLFILVTIFSLFLCFVVYKFCKAWYRSRSRQRLQPQSAVTHGDFLVEDHGPVLDHPIWYIRTIGLQPSIISAITICKYKRGEGLVEGTECSVCLNEFQEDETLRLLPKCNHAFHIPCIDTWLRSHTNCPLCRAGIVGNTAGLPSPEESIENSNIVEDTQVGILDNSGENGRESEGEASELRIAIEEEGEPRIENGIKSNENDKEELGNINHLEVNEVQPMRRSVSVDFLSGSMISAAITNANPVQSDRYSDREIVKVNESNMGIVPKSVDVNQRLLRLVGSSPIGRSLQKGPISMKRSFSYRGKVLFSRHSSNSSSRSRNSFLPL